MGSSGVLSEDINNPCRETELRKMFDKLKINLLPEYIKEVSEKDKTIDVTEEKKKLNAMLQEIFTKAAIDMKKKKDEFLSFFQVRDEDKNKKKWKYIELAVQNFQLITFHEESTHYQTMHKGNVIQQIEAANADEIRQRREYMRRVAAVTCMLGKRGLPLRGHDETAESHKGNFLEFMGLLQKFDPFLQHQTAPTSPLSVRMK
ncbi:hypothetical protein E1301_Tti022575 [Triplophysa tibetana]|uniref:Uncharacterized protein n=1 Tax=Triplophysa tibetana TaxID=1572043 RepID=A0A5A9PC26_9TELE|nr:hypothetical protein E1301_Tti022575 [Triplophysa tibetana]